MTVTNRPTDEKKIVKFLFTSTGICYHSKIYIRGGLDHKELAGRLAEMQQMERGVQLGAAADGMMTHTGNTTSLQWQEVGRRKGEKELVVIWADSVALVWLV